MATEEKEREVTFDLKEHIGIIGKDTKGWTRELNLVSWNGAAPKYDIRSWDESHQKMAKGITLTTQELSELKSLLSEMDL